MDCTFGFYDWKLIPIYRSGRETSTVEELVIKLVLPCDKAHDTEVLSASPDTCFSVLLTNQARHQQYWDFGSKGV